MRTTLLPSTSVVTMVNAPEEEVVVRNSNYSTSTAPQSTSNNHANPGGLSIMTGRQRRVKGYTRRRMRERRASMQSQGFKLKDNIRGVSLVLVAVLLFLTIEVIVVEKFVLSGKLSNVEERIRGGNVYVSDIVESSLNRYRLRPGIEFEKVIETAEEKVKAKAQIIGKKIEGKIEAAEGKIESRLRNLRHG